jgi:aminoglycoside/choline kinase family phosphotransferase
VHRDFHSLNVMVKNGTLAVIDFQDARIGPSAYDLVSLCFDSYVPFNNEQRMELMQNGIKHIGKKLGAEMQKEVEAHWKPMLLQRQLKAIGSFGYLTMVKKRGDYLKYVRPALATLANDLVFDQRWAFLSKDLLSMMIASKNLP